MHIECYTEIFFNKYNATVLPAHYLAYCFNIHFIAYSSLRGHNGRTCFQMCSWILTEYIVAESISYANKMLLNGNDSVFPILAKFCHSLVQGKKNDLTSMKAEKVFLRADLHRYFWGNWREQHPQFGFPVESVLRKSLLTPTQSQHTNVKTWTKQSTKQPVTKIPSIFLWRLSLLALLGYLHSSLYLMQIRKYSRVYCNSNVNLFQKQIQLWFSCFRLHVLFVLKICPELVLWQHMCLTRILWLWFKLSQKSLDVTDCRGLEEGGAAFLWLGFGTMSPLQKDWFCGYRFVFVSELA